MAAPHLPFKQTSCCGLSSYGTCVCPDSCHLLWWPQAYPKPVLYIQGSNNLGRVEAWLGSKQGRRCRASDALLPTFF
jgi:hypothetical protein